MAQPQEEGRRQQEMILSPNEFALIRDDTKGEVNTHVGPLKTSLATSDQPVIFDEKTKLFTPCSLQRAVQTLKTAPEGFYVILKNPAQGDKHPGGNGKLSTPELRVGKKVNISGPESQGRSGSQPPLQRVSSRPCV
jgi:major vault protein